MIGIERAPFLCYNAAMPLAFNSLSHGQIAFGFFNIETDMLLLDRCFFFASDFCRAVCVIAQHHAGEFIEARIDVHPLPYESIGDLHGAIAGTHLSGFIGEIYRLFPFPKQAEHFRQNPEGYSTRDTVEAIAERYVPRTSLALKPSSMGDGIAIGEYTFSRAQFHALLQYVWAGGYPRWKNDVRPGYVNELAHAASASTHPLFSGIGAFE